MIRHRSRPHGVLVWCQLSALPKILTTKLCFSDDAHLFLSPIVIMNRYPNRLFGQELYANSLKEGQPWADDRRAFESALRAMDHLERDTQRHYAHHRLDNIFASHFPMHEIPHHLASSGGRYYSSQYPTPDICLTRSNESLSSSESSDHIRWSGDGYRPPARYIEPAADYHRSSRQRGRKFQAQTPIYHRSSSGSGSPSSQNFLNQYVAPPPGSSSSRTGAGYMSSTHREEQHEESPNFGDPQQYPAAPTRTSSRHLGDALSQPLSPNQMQLVVHGSGYRQLYHQQDADDGQYTFIAPSTASPNWSAEATRDTSSTDRSLSITSSQGMDSDDSTFSGYLRSSGYAESYDVASYEDHHRRYNQHDIEEEHDFMSDGVASDEGVYYSSGDGLEYGEDGEDFFSDEYSEPEGDEIYDSYSD